MMLFDGRLRACDVVILQLVCCIVPIACLADTSLSEHWPQWGGPHRNFTVETSGLADKWPDDGPPRLWHRELGDGYSGIVCDEGVLYTMYRKESADENEYTVAIDAGTGKTLWEYAHTSPITEDMARYGPGPHSTPLVAGERLFTVGPNLNILCFKTKTGEVVWERDLLKEHKLTVPVYGYSASPLAYGDTIILPVVGEDAPQQIVVGLEQETGRTVWTSEPISRSYSEHCEYSSPILINVGGEDQVVFVTNERLAGFAANSGKLLWDHPCPSRTGVNVATPLWNGTDILLISGAYDAGARAIRLTHKDGKTIAEELWYSRKLRVHHASVVLVGGLVYGSSGDFGTALLAAMDLETGDPVWRHRGFAKANCIYADGKLIILDEDGQLALASPTRERLAVHSTCKVTDRISWTAPILVDKTLYVRDRKHIMALDVG